MEFAKEFFIAGFNPAKAGRRIYDFSLKEHLVRRGCETGSMILPEERVLEMFDVGHLQDAIHQKVHCLFKARHAPVLESGTYKGRLAFEALLPGDLDRNLVYKGQNAQDLYTTPLQITPSVRKRLLLSSAVKDFYRHPRYAFILTLNNVLESEYESLPADMIFNVTISKA